MQAYERCSSVFRARVTIDRGVADHDLHKRAPPRFHVRECRNPELYPSRSSTSVKFKKSGWSTSTSTITGAPTVPSFKNGDCRHRYQDPVCRERTCNFSTFALTDWQGIARQTASGAHVRCARIHHFHQSQED